MSDEVSDVTNYRKAVLASTVDEVGLCQDISCLGGYDPEVGSADADATAACADTVSTDCTSCTATEQATKLAPTWVVAAGCLETPTNVPSSVNPRRQLYLPQSTVRACFRVTGLAARMRVGEPMGSASSTYDAPIGGCLDEGNHYRPHYGIRPYFDGEVVVGGLTVVRDGAESVAAGDPAFLTFDCRPRFAGPGPENYGPACQWDSTSNLGHRYWNYFSGGHWNLCYIPWAERPDGTTGPAWGLTVRPSVYGAKFLSYRGYNQAGHGNAFAYWIVPVEDFDPIEGGTFADRYCRVSPSAMAFGLIDQSPFTVTLDPVDGGDCNHDGRVCDYDLPDTLYLTTLTSWDGDLRSVAYHPPGPDDCSYKPKPARFNGDVGPWKTGFTAPGGIDANGYQIIVWDGSYADPTQTLYRWPDSVTSTHTEIRYTNSPPGSGPWESQALRFVSAHLFHGSNSVNVYVAAGFQLYFNAAQTQRAALYARPPRSCDPFLWSAEFNFRMETRRRVADPSVYTIQRVQYTVTA